MTQPISFFVPGEPKAQPRPKAFARKFGDKWMARVYTPGSAESWKSAIAVAVQPFLPALPYIGAFKLEQVYYFARPKCHYKGKDANRLRDDAPTLHTCAPDGENLQKALQDALTQVGFWKDDALVAKWSGGKFYCDAEHPRQGAEITITRIADQARPAPPQEPTGILDLFAAQAKGRSD